jgi:hypothetical protein
MGSPQGKANGKPGWEARALLEPADRMATSLAGRQRPTWSSEQGCFIFLPGQVPRSEPVGLARSGR